MVRYTNAPVIIDEGFADTEDLDGLFSGFDPELGTYDDATWRYAGIADAEHAEGEHESETGQQFGGLGSPAGTERGARGRRDPPAPALRVPDPAPALQPLHPGAGRAGLRRARRAVPPGRRAAVRELGPGADDQLRLRGRLDPAHGRGPVHPDRGHPPAAAGQHRPARRRDHGPARARGHPGLHRHPDAVQPAARLHPHGQRRGLPRPGHLSGEADQEGRLLGPHGRLPRQPAQGVVGRGGHGRQRLLLRLPAPHLGRPLDLPDDPGHGRRQGAGLLPAGGEPGRRVVQLPAPAPGHGQARLAGGARPGRDRVGQLLV